MAERADILFWKGQDFATPNGPITLIPGENPIPVLVKTETLPPTHIRHHGDLKPYKASMRSRYAQLGLDIDESFETSITQAIMMQQQADWGHIDNPFITSANILNHTSRKIILPSNAHLFRLFRSFNKPLQGLEVVNALKNREIIIEGKQGIDWDFNESLDTCTQKHIISGLKVAIDGNRQWLPPGETPAMISDTARDFRSEIDQHLVPIPQSREPILWIGETPKLTINQSLEGVLDHIAFPNMSSEIVWTKAGTQINSHLIDSGTNWPIRVEILSSTTKDTMPDYVVFYFYRNGNFANQKELV